MILGHYKNKPVDMQAVRPGEIRKYLHTRVIEEKEISELESSVDIDLKNFCLDYKNLTYPIGASHDNTHIGDFIVAEKWEYPYWKKNGSVYVPSEDNPIGRYLVILAEGMNKISTSIHSWPLEPYGEKDFVQGDNSKGCIRLRREDMDEFFHSVDLGTRVRIKE
ncbi:MAG: L,D-transpeptidase [Candidatus Woesearchaeota archaeon]